ncbi:MAG TPA: hypothetical protein PLU72_02975 [Candidatus Ozemobacteraceae bacterium]|nr:hypothetical protein [Candidatus Ozemobacteraceae bacterium]HQG27903.1 hypothetical protein [Candidatus Ozemobacteraceae bacterium]
MQIPSNNQDLDTLLPKTVKVDLDTPLESAWTALAFMSGVGCFFILQIGFIGGKHTPPDPTFLKYLPTGLLALGVFIALRKFTDNFYIVDRQRKAVFYHFELAMIRSVTEYLRFSAIDAVVVNGSIHHSKHSRWYEYQILLVDRGGKIHAFSDSVRESELAALNKRAETLAKIIECRLVPGTAEHIHDITPGVAGKVNITSAHRPLNANAADLSNIQIPGWVALLVLMLVLAFFGFIAWAVLK